MKHNDPSMYILEGGGVSLAAYDSEWKNIYTDEAHALRLIFPSDQILIEHVGSTALPDVVGRPIIDIAISAKRSVSNASLDEILSQIGYTEMRATLATGTGRFFVKRKSGLIRYTLYVSEEGDELFSDMCSIRDYLSSHREERFLYSLLKENLLRSHGFDPRAYGAGKAPFMRAILKLAKGVPQPIMYERDPVLL